MSKQISGINEINTNPVEHPSSHRAVTWPISRIHGFKKIVSLTLHLLPHVSKRIIHLWICSASSVSRYPRITSGLSGVQSIQTSLEPSRNRPRSSLLGLWQSDSASYWLISQLSRLRLDVAWLTLAQGTLWRHFVACERCAKNYLNF